jgi:hypothetical protein
MYWLVHRGPVPYLFLLVGPDGTPINGLNTVVVGPYSGSKMERESKMRNMVERKWVKRKRKRREGI